MGGIKYNYCFENMFNNYKCYYDFFYHNEISFAND